MRLYTLLLRMWLTAWLHAVVATVVPNEQDFPPGHPARHDYNPKTPEAKEWARKHMHPKGERDHPVDHPKAVDTPGNTNSVGIQAGVDPSHPEREAFTGRSPEQAAAVRKLNADKAREALESPALEPVEAPEPPDPGDTRPPTGQPGVKGEVTRTRHPVKKRK